MSKTARLSESIVISTAAADRPSPGIALQLPAEFSFDCHGCRFSAVAEDSPDGAVVSVEGIVGAVPFSAESVTARARTRALLAMRPSSDVVRLELAGRNRIVLRGQAPLGDEPSPAAAIAAASAVLSAAKPLMDILALCSASALVRPIARSIARSIDRDDTEGEAESAAESAAVS